MKAHYTVNNNYFMLLSKAVKERNEIVHYILVGIKIQLNLAPCLNSSCSTGRHHEGDIYGDWGIPVECCHGNLLYRLFVTVLEIHQKVIGFIPCDNMQSS